MLKLDGSSSISSRTRIPMPRRAVVIWGVTSDTAEDVFVAATEIREDDLATRRVSVDDGMDIMLMV